MKDHEGNLILHEIIVREVVTPEGVSIHAVRFAPDGIDDPPLVTVLGLLEMAKNSAYEVYMNGEPSGD